MASTALLELESEILRYFAEYPENSRKYILSLRPEHFTFQYTRNVFEVLEDYIENSKKYDRTILLQDLREKTEQEIFDLPAEIEEDELKEYIRKLKNTAQKREIKVFLEESMLNLRKRTTARDFSGRAIDFFKGVMDDSAVGDEASITLADFVETHRLAVEEVKSGGMLGITSGIPTLDEYLIGGYKKGDLVLVGARPSVGKTSFSLTSALAAARAGQNVLFISVEMKAKDVFDRLLSFVSGKPLTDIVRAEVDLEPYYQELSKLNFRIVEAPKATSRDVVTIATRDKYVNGMDLLVVDYLQYLADVAKGQSEAVRVGRISRNLKSLAGVLDIPVLSPVQLSRRPEHRTGENQGIPTLADLRDSGNLEQDADIVLLISRKITVTPGEAVLHIAKNRKGETGAMPLSFNVTTTQFEEDNNISSLGI